jgi:hypothetical protein
VRKSIPKLIAVTFAAASLCAIFATAPAAADSKKPKGGPPGPQPTEAQVTQAKNTTPMKNNRQVIGPVKKKQ